MLARPLRDHRDAPDNLPSQRGRAARSPDGEPDQAPEPRACPLHHRAPQLSRAPTPQTGTVVTTDPTLRRQRFDVSASPGGARHRQRRRLLLHRSASMAARCGYFVFPVAPLGKVPALKDVNWAEIATRDLAALARWWGSTPYNVGIVT